MTVAPMDLPGCVPNAVQQLAEIVEHEPMARNTWRMRLRCPEIARRILPGQFFMIRVPGRSDPLLGRPFALYDVFGNTDGPEGVDFGYVVVGKLTSLLTSLGIGEKVEIWGPLGNGFPPPPEGHLIIAAGGIGQTPFLAVIREALKRREYGDPARKVVRPPSKITLCYGVRSAEYLAGVDEFQKEGIDVRIATDDGSAGHHGFVTDLVKQIVGRPSSGEDQLSDRTTIICCGPEPMMNAVSQLAESAKVPCWLSLETPMACGFGACFSCVARIKQADGEWDYRRVCVEGPVFPADKVVFGE